MHEILRHLPGGARVLDLGSGKGSFGSDCYPGLRLVRLDPLRPGAERVPGLVLGVAAWLPFRDGAFDAVIASHSLEHVEELERVLSEIGRVMRRDGCLYVAVPDASTLTDRIYRWMCHGGGHINPFRSHRELATRIARATGLHPAGMRELHTSLEFLRRDHFGARPPRRLWIFGHGNATFLGLLTYLLRGLDRLLGTRASVYGWAFYFGNVQEEIETAPWSNVCVGCGTGHSEASLLVNKRVWRRFLVFRSYLCPICGGWNLFTRDRPGQSSAPPGAVAGSVTNT
ncbi:MAG TPA: methyltransferase domain-containing protein [Bryobacteraceae bacterium]|nr:methyltransferase domain-containing protein [Bryobacteraceae bacterium]